MTPEATRPVLLVATPYDWVARDLAACQAARVLHSHGLDVPELGELPVAGLWAPAPHAARLQAAGLRLPLVATGPRWLADLGPEILGRRIWAGQLGDVSTQGWAAGFAKPAEVKVAALPARWYDDLDEFTAAAAAHLPRDSWVQVADRHLDLDLEVRIWFTGHKPVAWCPYLYRGSTELPLHLAAELATAADSAALFAEQALVGVAMPPATVVDVARLPGGRFIVLESNPAWCSGLYTADPDGVVETLIAAFTESATGWSWEPDPVLLTRIAKLPALAPGGYVRELDAARNWVRVPVQASPAGRSPAS